MSEIRGYLDEIDGDLALRAHVRERTLASDQRGLADRHVRFGRRVGWYALIRAVKPHSVVETGTDKGLGSCVMLSDNSHATDALIHWAEARGRTFLYFDERPANHCIGMVLPEEG